MKHWLVCSSAVLMGFAAACSSSNPAQPSGAVATSVSAAAATTIVPQSASITAPRPVAPLSNALIRNVDQPVTLVAQNAVITKPSGTTYTFELATDAAFTTNVQTKTGVAEGAGGQTSLKLDVQLAGRDYFWHVRAISGGTTGVFGPAFRFTVGPAIVLGAPVPIAPLTGAQTTSRPTLRVTNAPKQGPAGAVTYKFEISTTSAFTSTLVSGTSSEGVTETDFVSGTDLPTTGTLFWRATATDAANGVTSPSSAVQGFTANKPSQAEVLAARLGIPLWPRVVPPGVVGHATMGEDAALGVGWDIKTLHYDPGNVDFQIPDIEMLRFFDLFDRGFDPETVVAWMNQNGYPTNALWYPPPEKAVLGLQFVYIAARNKVTVNATWDVVLRIE